MKTFILLISAIAALSAHASEVVSGLDNQSLESLVQVPPPHEAKCPDYAGNWVGQCQSAKGNYEIGLKIAQKNCAFIAFDSDLYAIGGSRQVRHSIPRPGGDLFSVVTTLLNWNPEKTALIARTSAVVSKTGQGVISQAESVGKVVMKDGKLFTLVSGTGLDVSCTLEKR